MIKNKLLLFITIIILACLTVTGCGPGTDNTFYPADDLDKKETYSKVAGNLVVHYIDVGQGDAIFIELPSDENILIDAGEIDKGEQVLNYLKTQGVTKIDHLVATHPHSDHIGGMKTIVENLDIGKVYMPRASHATQTYENLLLSIKNKGLKITEAKAGVVLETSHLCPAEFIAPNSSSYKSINDYSAVLKLKYQEHIFLFTGDAEAVSGQEILVKGIDIKAQFLDVPHHGSTNSLLTKEFLKKVSPEVAVISTGKDNSYGHPHQEILDMLDESGVQVLRTDLEGNIVISSDGEKFTINNNAALDEEPGAGISSPPEGYIGNKNSKVLHLPTCKNLPLEHNRKYFAGKAEAVEEGYKLCTNCKP